MRIDKSQLQPIGLLFLTVALSIVLPVWTQLLIHDQVSLIFIVAYASLFGTIFFGICYFVLLRMSQRSSSDRYILMGSLSSENLARTRPKQKMLMVTGISLFVSFLSMTHSSSMIYTLPYFPLLALMTPIVRSAVCGLFSNMRQYFCLVLLFGSLMASSLLPMDISIPGTDREQDSNSYFAWYCIFLGGLAFLSLALSIIEQLVASDHYSYRKGEETINTNIGYWNSYVDDSSHIIPVLLWAHMYMFITFFILWPVELVDQASVHYHIFGHSDISNTKTLFMSLWRGITLSYTDYEHLIMAHTCVILYIVWIWVVFEYIRTCRQNSIEEEYVSASNLMQCAEIHQGMGATWVVVIACFFVPFAHLFFHLFRTNNMMGHLLEWHPDIDKMAIYGFLPVGFLAAVRSAFLYYEKENTHPDQRC